MSGKFWLFEGTEFWEGTRTLKFLHETEYFKEGDSQVFVVTIIFMLYVILSGLNIFYALLFF